MRLFYLKFSVSAKSRCDHPEMNNNIAYLIIFTKQHIFIEYSHALMLYYCIEVVLVYDEFVRNRITQLRLKKGVSEYRMGYDLGHSRGYVYNISSGKSLPPMSEFFAICEYFNITPAEFFDDCNSNPELIRKALSGLKRLNDGDLLLILNLIDRMLD